LLEEELERGGLEVQQIAFLGAVVVPADVKGIIRQHDLRRWRQAIENLDGLLDASTPGWPK